MKRITLVILTLCGVSPLCSQDFTRSHDEHTLREVEIPIRVKAIRGFITLQGAGDPLPDVLFELQGPGSIKKIRRAVTKENGRISISVPNGTYRFKATLRGFQSIIGVFIETADGDASREFHLEMSYGV